MGREGDLVEARCEAGEDARVEVEDAIASSWTSCIIEVRKEGVKCHSLGRIDGTIPPGRDENNRKVARRWFCQSIVGKVVGRSFLPQRFLLHLLPQFGH